MIIWFLFSLGAVSAVEDGPRSQEEKEAMYSRVAQRLAEMADSYAQSFSDQEGRGAAVVTPPGEFSCVLFFLYVITIPSRSYLDPQISMQLTRVIR